VAGIQHGAQVGQARSDVEQWQEAEPPQQEPEIFAPSRQLVSAVQARRGGAGRRGADPDRRGGAASASAALASAASVSGANAVRARRWAGQHETQQ